jgi:hypothetical protein
MLTTLAVANIVSLWPAAIFHISKFQGVTVSVLLGYGHEVEGAYWKKLNETE